MKPKYTPRRDPKNTTKSISLPKNIVMPYKKKPKEKGEAFQTWLLKFLKIKSITTATWFLQKPKQNMEFRNQLPKKRIAPD